MLINTMALLEMMLIVNGTNVDCGMSQAFHSYTIMIKLFHACVFNIHMEHEPKNQ